MEGKIALEEHISTEENNALWDSTGEASRNGPEYMADAEKRLVDATMRLEEMDRLGIERMVLSLTSPGTESILDPKRAIDFARRTNDLLAERWVAAHPSRFSAFATVPLQEPKAAADELERAVTGLGMKGALVNGYTNVGDSDTARYLDEPPVREFWERVAALDVPVYLHPREPLKSQRRWYEGYPALVGSALGFAFETASHAVRLMLSGLFDEYPNLTIILGHLGEGLPLLLPRLQWRLFMQRHGAGLGSAEKSVGEYFSNNFYVTTSGHFHTQALMNAMSELGTDRVMFSADYPYERLEPAVRWFDSCPISDNDRRQIGRDNALRLLRL